MSYKTIYTPVGLALLKVSGHNWLDPNGVQHDITHKRTATETILNWMLINLNQLQKM